MYIFYVPVFFKSLLTERGLDFYLPVKAILWLSSLLALPIADLFFSKTFLCDTYSLYSASEAICQGKGSREHWEALISGPREVVGGFNFAPYFTLYKNFYLNFAQGSIFHSIFMLLFMAHFLQSAMFMHIEYTDQLDQIMRRKIVSESTEKIIFIFDTVILAILYFIAVLLLPIHKLYHLNYYDQYGSISVFLLCPFALIGMFTIFFPTFGHYFVRRNIGKRISSVYFEEVARSFRGADNVFDREESLYLEFKSSFQTSYPQKPQKIKDEGGKIYFSIGGKRRFQSEKEIEKLLQDMTLEAVVGFLNSAGGMLVIGVGEKDNIKELIGIDYEGFSSEDEYERHIIQQIINRIGKNFLGDYITTAFRQHECKTFFVISIKPYLPGKGQIPALLDGTKCFKRTGPRTDTIEPGAEFASFVANRIVG